MVACEPPRHGGSRSHVATSLSQGGCRRCADVCPVGEDYDELLKNWVDEIAEETPEKLKRLEAMIAEATLPASYENQRRWIGDLNPKN